MKFDLHYLLSGKSAQWCGVALISLFSLLIILECLGLQFSPIHTPVVSTTDKNLLTANQPEDFKSIVHSSLFGVYVSNDLNETSVKKSMLNVTLVGILFAAPIDDSQVIIRASNGEEKTYNMGDTIPGEATIKRITPGGILVERHGALESLSLPKDELTFEPVPEPLKEE